MSTTFVPQINEVDRKTQQGFSSGKSVETAGPLAMLPVSLLSTPVYDDFSSSNPFAQSSVDYSQYSESPVSSTSSETSYSVAMNFVSSESGFSAGDCGGFSDGGAVSSASSGDCGGGSCGSFSASC